MTFQVAVEKDERYPTSLITDVREIKLTRLNNLEMLKIAYKVLMANSILSLNQVFGKLLAGSTELFPKILSRWRFVYGIMYNRQLMK
jgi:hypothetical protein